MNDNKQNIYMDNDVYRRVPMNERQSWVSFLMIFIGMWASLAAIGVGVDLGTQLTPWKASLAIFIGYVICLIFGAFVGEIGRREGLSIAVLCERPFSKYGKLVPAFVIFMVAGIFIGVQADVVTRIGMSIVGIPLADGFDVTRGLIAAALCALMMFTSYKGIKYIKALSWISIPIFVILLAVGLVLVIRGFPGGLASILTLEANEISFTAVMFIGVSLYAGFSAEMPDIARFVRTRSGLIKALVIGYLVSAIIPIWGIIMGAALGSGEYWVIFAQYGLAFGIFAAIGLFLAQWTTNDNNAFSSGLALSTIFTTLHSRYKSVPRLTRKQATLVPAILGVVLAFMGSGSVSGLYAFVEALGSWLVPIAGVLIAHYYIVERGNRKVGTKGLSGLISMFTVGLLTQLGLMPLAAIMTIIGSIVLYVVVYYAIEKPLFGEMILKEELEEKL